MNPELLRNIWVELTERRLLLTGLVIAALLLMSFTSGGLEGAVGTAETVFYGIVVVWGTRMAANAVVEEIAGKTWDAQRLSAIAPWTMVWGKLIGATALAWFGGLICLSVIVFADLAGERPEQAVDDIVYFAGMGLFAHAVAMMASLVAVRRRLSHSRFDVFIYQLFGLVAAGLVWRVWQTADPDSLFRRWNGGAAVLDTVRWWGLDYTASGFYVGSLLSFVAWTLIANYRLMRTELQVRNGPLVWLAFIAYVAIYAAGFDEWRNYIIALDARIGVRAVQAGLALAVVTYVMAFVEPKEVVAYRWLVRRFGQGHLFAFVARLPAWAFAYAATFAAGIVVILFIPWDQATIGNSDFGRGGTVVASGLGFLLRDCGIFIVMGLGQVGKRSDLGALAILGLAYVILPGLLGGYGSGAGVFFFPGPFEPTWLNPLLAWAQAIFVWALILRRPDLHEPAPS